MDRANFSVRTECHDARREGSSIRAMPMSYTANLGVGGLEFTTSESIVMEKEDLYISRELVKIDYVFRNITDKPVELRVAFPLPTLDVEKILGCDYNISIPLPQNPNFVGFKTFV
jgi:hypothetical protein